MTTLRLTSKGLQQVPNTGILVKVCGKFISGALNTLPGGKEKKMRFFLGNAAGSVPFSFATMELALDALKTVFTLEGKCVIENHVRFFNGNNWFGEMKNMEITIFENPIKQLL